MIVNSILIKLIFFSRSIHFEERMHKIRRDLHQFKFNLISAVTKRRRREVPEIVFLISTTKIFLLVNLRSKRIKCCAFANTACESPDGGLL